MKLQKTSLAMIVPLGLAVLLLTACDSGSSSSPTAPPMPVAQASLSAATLSAMDLAIEDEYLARATYAAVIDKFGPIDPFVRIQEAEATHIQALTDLFGSYLVTVPSDPHTGNIPLPDTVAEVCQLGVEAEEANIALYDGFFGFVTEADVIAVFQRLRSASLDSHLPAFRACS